MRGLVVVDLQCKYNFIDVEGLYLINGMDNGNGLWNGMKQ